MADEHISRLMRTCTSCSQDKPLSVDFFPCEDGRLRRQCRTCRAAVKRRWRSEKETAEQRQRRLAGARTYAAANAERISVGKAAYTEANKDHLKAYQRARYLANKDEAKERARRWRIANRERKLEANRAWAGGNKDKANKSGRDSKARRRQNPAVRLCDSISASVRFSLKARKNGRGWEALLGYSVERLVEHLERQFTKGMSWDNYGEWHVDHILPVASFKFESADDSEFRACWALTNLRPLWAAENIRKSDNRLHLI